MIKTTNPSLTASTIEISKNKSTIYALPSRNKKNNTTKWKFIRKEVIP